jgi:hypothetical protein
MSSARVVLDLHHLAARSLEPRDDDLFRDAMHGKHFGFPDPVRGRCE